MQNKKLDNLQDDILFLVTFTASESLEQSKKRLTDYDIKF